MRTQQTSTNYDLSGVVATTLEVLSPGERDRKEALERTIQAGVQSAREAGAALLEIRDRRLYRAQYESFEAYCTERWGFSARHGHRMADFGEVVAGLLTEGGGALADDRLPPVPLPLPETESQARPLKGVEPERRREVWSEAVAVAGGKVPTARQVAAAAAAEKDKGAEQTGAVAEADAVRFDVSRAKLFLEVIEDELGKLIEMGGNTACYYHLEQAKYHLGCYRAQALGEQKEQKQKGSRKDAKTPSPKEQSAKDRAAAAAELFVVCREPMPGSIVKKPRYGPGWTADPNKAGHYRKGDAALIRAREKFDLVMPLKKALRRFEKGL